MAHHHTRNPNKVKEIIVGGAALILFVILYLWMLQVFRHEGQERTALLTVSHNESVKFLKINVRVVSIDPLKGDVNLRMEFDPEGKLASQQDFLLEHLELYVNNSAGKQEYEFPPGTLISPIDITLSMYDGMVSDYPFDSYDAQLWIEATSQIKNDTTGAIENINVDRELNFSGSIHGFRIDAVSEPQPPQITAVHIDISRTRSVLIFSMFVMVLMWCLAFGVLFVVLSVVIRKRKVELGLLGFNTGMLFALPAFRNMQPFSPPIGCLSDYLSFFWVEAIFAISLLTLIIMWLKRPGVKHEM